MAKIYIMRGLPGAGKSTWAQENHPGAHVCSADSFFVDDDGVYRFDGTLISEAHASCLRQFAKILASMEESVENSPEVVVVDNTAIRAWEISPYYNLARAYGHDVRIVHVKCDTETAHSRNIHGVPLERVEKMNDGLACEALPPFWTVETVGGCNN
ncbi:MAG: ATP-binding protein [Candidatus Aegiribacteria sp.]|nr:ATP-binding protein [Candidatus Aegiribacteria sp.]